MTRWSVFPARSKKPAPDNRFAKDDRLALKKRAVGFLHIRFSGKRMHLPTVKMAPNRLSVTSSGKLRLRRLNPKNRAQCNLAPGCSP
jgi:hypothetical protein